MIPILSDNSVPPGGAASGLLTQPGAALRGGGASLDFAGLLSAALPEGEAAAPAITNLPAQVADFGPQLRAASDTAPPPAAPAPPTPTTAAPAPSAFAPRLPTGTILPESGRAVPPTAKADVAPALQTVPAPAPEAAIPVIAVELRADTTGELHEQSEPITLPDSEEEDETSLDTSAPVSAAAPIVAPVVLAAAPPAMTTLPPPSTPARTAIRSEAPRAAPTIRAEHRPLPAHIALPETESETAATPAQSAPISSETQQPISTSANGPQPVPTTPGLAPQPIAPSVMAERAEPRAAVADQESAIAAVGEIREALRAVRPEMTLRHAEFGQVSLRIEPTGTQDWRAVLASRDPGFVPAIQAALAERAVAATADAASTSNNPGQNSASDQRYGASPNGGQGSSQPYLGHSATRDEGQSSQSQNRQPSTTDAVVARAGEAEAERPDRSERGVFA